IPIYADLGAFAARVLMPGGLLLAYTGSYYIPNALDMLRKHLSYAHIFAAHHAGPASSNHSMRLMNSWKAILCFAKQPLRPWWRYFRDWTEGNREKEFHPWQQAESEATYFIEHLTRPGGLVVDPFAGSGTTLAAATSLGRPYLGIEIDAGTAAKARARLAATGTVTATSA